MQARNDRQRTSIIMNVLDNLSQDGIQCCSGERTEAQEKSGRPAVENLWSTEGANSPCPSAEDVKSVGHGRLRFGNHANFYRFMTPTYWK